MELLFDLLLYLGLEYTVYDVPPVVYHVGMRSQVHYLITVVCLHLCQPSALQNFSHEISYPLTNNMDCIQSTIRFRVRVAKSGALVNILEVTRNPLSRLDGPSNHHCGLRVNTVGGCQNNKY